MVWVCLRLDLVNLFLVGLVNLMILCSKRGWGNLLRKYGDVHGSSQCFHCVKRPQNRNGGASYCFIMAWHSTLILSPPPKPFTFFSVSNDGIPLCNFNNLHYWSFRVSQHQAKLRWLNHQTQPIFHGTSNRNIHIPNTNNIPTISKDIPLNPSNKIFIRLDKYSSKSHQQTSYFDLCPWWGLHFLQRSHTAISYFRVAATALIFQPESYLWSTASPPNTVSLRPTMTPLKP